MAKKILIADSDPLFLESLSNQIKNRQDCDVATVFDGQEALNKGRKDSPNLMILEEGLASLDAFKLSRLFKFDKKRSHIPIIILTSHLDEQNEALAKEVGADGYLLHTIDDKLLEKIDALLTN